MGGVAAISLLSALTYGTYRAIKAGINYYNLRNAKKNLLDSIDEFLYDSFFCDLLTVRDYNNIEKKSYENIFEVLGIDKQIINNLNKLKEFVLLSQKDASNMEKAKETINKVKETINKVKETINEAKETINKVKEIKEIEKVKKHKNEVLEELIELFNEIENNYEKYCEEYDKLNSNK